MIQGIVRSALNELNWRLIMIRVTTQDRKHGGYMLSILDRGVETELFFLFGAPDIDYFWPDAYR